MSQKTVQRSNKTEFQKSSNVAKNSPTKQQNQIFKVSGVVRYLFVGGQIATIKEKEIERIKIFCTLANVKIEKQSFEIGEEIEVISGELIGLRGQLTSSTTGHKLKINISALGCFATIRNEKLIK